MLPGDEGRARLCTWNGERSRVLSRDQSRIPRYLGSTCSSPGTPDSLLLNFSDSEDMLPCCNVEVIHARTESQPASRTTSGSSCRGGRARSATTGGYTSSTNGGRVRSLTTGSRCPSSLSSSWSRNTGPRNSKSTSNISAAVSPTRPQLTRSQSRIPRYLGSSSSISSLSPMSADYRLPGLDADFSDLAFSDSDSSERTRCASTCVAHVLLIHAFSCTCSYYRLECRFQQIGGFSMSYTKTGHVSWNLGTVLNENMLI